MKIAKILCYPVVRHNIKFRVITQIRVIHKLGLLVNARRRGMMVSRIKIMHEVVMEWMCTLLVIV